MPQSGFGSERLEEVDRVAVRITEQQERLPHGIGFVELVESYNRLLLTRCGGCPLSRPVPEFLYKRTTYRYVLSKPKEVMLAPGQYRIRFR